MSTLAPNKHVAPLAARATSQSSVMGKRGAEMVWVVFGGTLVWVLRTLARLWPVWLGRVYKCIWRVGCF